MSKSSLQVERKIVIKAGWILDSVEINGTTVGGRGGHNYYEFYLDSNETIAFISFEYCYDYWFHWTVTNLKFETSKGKIYGPFGACKDRMDLKSFEINNLNEIEFIATPDGKFVGDIRLSKVHIYLIVLFFG